MNPKIEIIKNNFRRPGMRLGYIAAYYKNDKPGGIGIKAEDERTVATLRKLVETKLIEYEETLESKPEKKDELVNRIFAQLEQWGKEQTPLETIGGLAVANILFLEMNNLIERDEFNGCIMGFIP